MKTDGLPGTVTPLSYTLPRKLGIKEWARALDLLGGMAQGMTWWIADALLFGEEHYGESFSQYVDLVGVNPKTAVNIMAVARSIPAARRREALTFGHHDAVSILDPEDQDYWMDRAEQGDPQPAGGKTRWSVQRLRTELRALGPGTSLEFDPLAARQTPPDSPLIVEGLEIAVRWAEQGIVHYRVEFLQESEDRRIRSGKRLDLWASRV